VLQIVLVLFNVVVFSTVFVCVIVGVGTFDVLVELFITTGVGKTSVETLVLRISFATVCVTATGVEVDFMVVMMRLLIVMVCVARTLV